MQTFTQIKDLVDNPHYDEQRQKCLSKLGIRTIDAPITDIVSSLAKLPYCFTLQSCYGHFLHKHQKSRKNTDPLPVTDSITRVEYRIAYIALCIQNNNAGRELLRDLQEIPAIDPDYIQFGCAEWFWGRQVNSYALQVEPERHMAEDRAYIDYREALHVEKVRNEFVDALRKLLQKRRV